MRMTEGKFFQMGCRGSEASRQERVSGGSAIHPSRGCGCKTILNPSEFMAVNSQKKAIALMDLRSSASVI
jgi:hypothetical protein